MKISDEIRNAAINWPQFLSNEESWILDAFNVGVGGHWIDDLVFGNEDQKTQARVFMLLVAEALE